MIHHVGELCFSSGKPDVKPSPNFMMKLPGCQIWICAGIGILSAYVSRAGIVNIDFNLGATPTHAALGAAPDSPGNVKWNGLALTGGSAPGTANATSTFTGLVFSDNTPSGMSVTIQRTGQSDIPNADNNAADLLRDYAYVNSGSSSTRLSATFIIDGLTAGMVYDLYLYGSGGQSGQKTAFTIGETTLQTTGPSAATTELTAGEDYVRFEGIAPNVSNQIIVTYANVNDGIGPNQTGPFNGCQIVAVPPSPLLSIRLPNASQYRLAWPVSAADYQLETSTDFTLWENVMDEPTVIDSEFVLTADIAGPRRFFRLHRP